MLCGRRASQDTGDQVKTKVTGYKSQQKQHNVSMKAFDCDCSRVYAFQKVLFKYEVETLNVYSLRYSIHSLFTTTILQLTVRLCGFVS